MLLPAAEGPGAAGLGDDATLPAVDDEPEHGSTAERSALFSGSAEAEARSKHFDGPGQEVIDEREQTALLQLGEEVEDDDGSPDGEHEDDDPADPEDGVEGTRPVDG